MGHRGPRARDRRHVRPADAGPAERYAEPATEGDATEQLALDRDPGPAALPAVRRAPRARHRPGPAPRARAPAARRDRREVDLGRGRRHELRALGRRASPSTPSTSTSSPAGLLIIRKAQRGEKLVTLDGVERVLEPSDVVVADAERAVSLAGIMGGLDTAVTRGHEERPARGRLVGPGHRAQDRAPPRHAHRRVAPLRARRRPRRHSRCARPTRRGCSSRPPAERSRPDSSTPTGPCCASGKRPCACRGCACSRATGGCTSTSPRRRSGGWGSRRSGEASTSPSRSRSSAATCGAKTTSSKRSCGSTATTGCPSRLPAGGRARRPQGAAAADRGAAGRRGRGRRPLRDGELSLRRPRRRRGGIGRLAAADGDGSRAARDPQSPGRVPAPPARDAASGAARRRVAATSATARPRSVSSRSAAPSGRRASPTGRNPTSRAGSPSRSRARGGATGACPPPLRPADFFDAKGLVERLVAPWIPAEELVWKPAAIQAFTPRASAIAHTRAGEVLAVVGLLSESERERHGLDAPVFAGEILVDALPVDGRPVRLPSRSRRCRRSPPISRSSSRGICRGRESRSACAVSASPTWSPCAASTDTKAREFRGGFLKTTIRLTFRSLGTHAVAGRSQSRDAPARRRAPPAARHPFRRLGRSFNAPTSGARDIYARNPPEETNP